MSPGTGAPRTVTSPLVGRASPRSMRISVVLPAPFGPRKPKAIPAGTCKLTPSTALSEPNRFVRSTVSMTRRPPRLPGHLTPDRAPGDHRVENTVAQIVLGLVGEDLVRPLPRVADRAPHLGAQVVRGGDDEQEGSKPSRSPERSRRISACGSRPSPRVRVRRAARRGRASPRAPGRATCPRPRRPRPTACRPAIGTSTSASPEKSSAPQVSPGHSCRHAVARMCSAVRSANAQIVAVGFIAPEVTKTLPSTTNRFGTSCVRPNGSQTSLRVVADRGRCRAGASRSLRGRARRSSRPPRPPGAPRRRARC